MKDEYRAVEDLVRFSYANVVWTHKIQEKQAEKYSNRYKLLSVINIGASAMTTAGIITAIFVDPLGLKIASAVISFITTAISAFLSSFNYKDMSAANKSTATKLIGMRDDLITLLVKVKYEKESPDGIMDEYEKLRNDLQKIYDEAPNTSNKACKKAKIEIENGNFGIYTDDEIDQLLPKILRGNQSDIVV